jgi:serine/threonine protein kinase
MSVVARDKVIEDLHRSRLIDDERLDRFLAEHEAEADGEALLSQLIAAGLITAWQSERLLAGKWRDFFLGKYKILDLLGSGGMGSVFLAEHRVMRHRVAIKVLARHLLATPNIVARFEREARAAARINHPNVVRAYDIDHERKAHFLVMEYVEGDDLRKIVDRNGPLDPRVAAEYIQQVARGLQEAHSCGLVHRDIKPANLLLDPTGTVKILDLGLARLDDEVAAEMTQSGDSKVLGTVDYLAPEQALNSHNIDSRADLYSLGCTLYFLLTGVPPFPKGSATERMVKHQTHRPLDIRKRRPGVPDALVEICNRLMEKQPDKRFETAADVAAVLGDFLEGRYRTAGSADDELLLAEDVESGSGISRQGSGQSKTGSGRLASSTAVGSSRSSNTVSSKGAPTTTALDDLDLAPDMSASRSSQPQPAVPSPEPNDAQPAENPAFGLTPLGSSANASVFDQLASSGLDPLGALPSLGDQSPVLGPLAGNPLDLSGPIPSPLLGPTLSSPTPANSKDAGEVQYPLWVLLGIGLLLGLAVVGVGALLYFLFR